jgi:hypothetical protein
MCGSAMSHSPVPGARSLPEFKCEKCDLSDPVTSANAARWIQGELRPPK